MSKLALVVAHANNRVIGKNNTMPWHLPADLAHFKATTLGKPVLMGRKTFESIGKPLPGRQNVVVTRDATFDYQGIEVVNNLEQGIQLLSSAETIMVIGGGSVYKALLPKADELFITHIEADIDGDTQFPEYDLNNWVLMSEQVYPKDEKNAYDMRFCHYHRR